MSKFLGKVVENTSYIQIFQQTNSFVYIEPALLPQTVLVKLNSHHVSVKFTERNSTFLGGEGEGFDFSNFALSVSRLLASFVGQTIWSTFHQGDADSVCSYELYKKGKSKTHPFNTGS